MESPKLPQPYEKFESTIEDIRTGAKQVRYLRRRVRINRL
jgi:hypothetical protein